MEGYEDRKNEVKRLREDKKIKPVFAPGQDIKQPITEKGDSKMGSPFGQQPNNSPFGAKPNTPPAGGSPFGQQTPPSGSPFGAKPTGSPFGQTPPPTGSPFGQRPSPFGQPQGGQGGTFGRPPMSNGFGTTPQNNMNQQQQPQTKSMEDKLGETFELAGKASWSFFGQFGNSLKKSDTVEYKRGANNSFIMSSVLGAVSLILGIFKHDIFYIFLGSIIVLGLSILMNFLISRSNRYLEDLKKRDDAKKAEEEAQNTPPPMPVTPTTPPPTPEPDDISDDDLFADDEDEDDDLDDDWEDDDPDDEDEDYIQDVPEEGDPDKALSSLETMNKSMVSRQFLYESMVEAGQKITPSYKKRINVDESSDKFDRMDTMFYDVFTVLGFEEEEIENIETYTETLLVDYIKIDRPSKKFKEEDFDKELTQMLRKGYDGVEGNNKMFSRSEFIGRQMVTKVFKGKSPMISVADVLKANKEFYLDSDKHIPYILGINAEGQEVKMDLEDAESILISGKPRSGKSFTVRQLLTQMMYFNSPEDLQFYIGDVKDATSDYYKLHVPHVKCFKSNDLDILNMLKNLVEVEAKRRSEAFKEAGVIKIKDYHDKYPDKKDMPYIYVILDEMVGLATQLKNRTLQGDKDTPKYLNIYFGYLSQLVTQLPAYGIRLIAVPHRVTNDFIPKTASDNMMFKIAVAADEELLKETLNTTQRKFGYKATNKGDLSVSTSIVSPEPFYCKSLVPSSNTIESDKMFDFLASFWNKIVPPDKDDSSPKVIYGATGRTTDSSGSRGMINKSHFDATPVATAPTASKQKKNEPLKDTDGGDGLDFDDLFN